MCGGKTRTALQSRKATHINGSRTGMTIESDQNAMRQLLRQQQQRGRTTTTRRTPPRGGNTQGGPRQGVGIYVCQGGTLCSRPG
jgi:hypothetical protein